ncbi:MAG: hypothetical protein ACP5JB_07210 [candidate division WOR-3 bacterium]
MPNFSPKSSEIGSRHQQFAFGYEILLATGERVRNGNRQCRRI